MTIIENVRKGNLIPQIVECAQYEGVPPEQIAEGIKSGRVVLPYNNVRPRRVRSVAIGENLLVKVNANIGTSEDKADIDFELEKLTTAIEAGADTVMDLSTGGDLDKIRMAIISNSSIPVGTVPVYELAVKLSRDRIPFIKMSPDQLFETIESQAKQGVDFMTVHCGVTKRTVEMILQGKRIMNVVSRGGAFLFQWICTNEKENPLYEHFDRLLEIAHKYDVTLSLGDGMRPGAVADATDDAQIEELITLGELVLKAREAGVQAMVEGPGHVPINQIELNMRLEKSLCYRAPFYILGPVVTDIAPGYDHITSAIGGAWAAYFGADFLCYVTQTEHLSLPNTEAVREGVIVTKIAAHAADLARGNPKAWEWDRKMSRARFSLDWEKQIELAIDPQKAQKIREALSPQNQDVCTMCGEYCALKLIRETIPEKQDK